MYYNIKNEYLSRAVQKCFGVTAALLCGVAPTWVYAAEDVELADGENSTSIIVTGSRVVRDGYNAPTPLTVVGQDVLEAKSTTQIIDALAELPAFRATATASTAGLSNSGTAGQSFVNLRGLGANRTLVLVDGQRFVPSTSIGTVDVGLVPSLLIDRVDIVTGGASAAYGSDAVTGVVNFVLNNRLEGFKTNLEASITQYGDNETYKGGMAWGARLGDSVHVVLSGEYAKSEGVYAGTRDNMQSEWNIVTNSSYAPGTGQYKRYILPNVYLNRVTYGGVIWGGPLDGTTFEKDGTFGQYPTNILIGGPNDTTVIMDSSTPGQPWGRDIAIPIVPVETGKVYGRVSVDVSENAEIYASGLYAENNPGPFQSTPAQTRITGFHVIGRDNAFLPAEIADLMDQSSLTSINVGRYSLDWGPSIITRNNATTRGVIGINSDFASGWEFSAYAQYGENKNVFTIENNVLKAEQKLAVDAVDNGAGQIVCRSTLSDPDNGCIPLNIFGEGAASSSAIDYIMGTSRANLKYTQQVYAANISGEPFALWAGPVSFAAGIEHRRETLDQTVDGASEAFRFHIGNPQPLSGEIAVTEGFVEAVIPLLEGQTFFETLDLNGAYRYAHYDTSGGVSTWKLGLNWELVEGLRLRGTRSRDIRAPNITELYTSPVQQTRGVANPWTNVNETPQTFSLGNQNLKPEVADTAAVGIVLQPVFMPGFSLSLDYYNISIESAITTLAVQDLVDRCFGGNQELCALITLDQNNTITAIDLPYLNLSSVKTDGLDFEASYRTALGAGDLSLRFLANRMFSLTYDDGNTVVDRAGDISNGNPKFNANFLASYSTERLRFDMDVNYIGSGNYDNTYAGVEDINDNTISDRLYLGAQFTLKLPSGEGQRRDIYLRVSNITNSLPPGIFQYGGGANYDLAGRSFKLGARAEF